MKLLLFATVLLLSVLTSKAQLDVWPKMKNLELTEIRTASNTVLVAYFLGPNLNEVDTTNNGWQLNDKKPESIDKWVTSNWSGIEFGYEHHVYLTLKSPLVQGQKYELKTPYGNKTFTFNSKAIFCESIKTNQSAYSPLSKVRYANFAIWKGTGGSEKIQGQLPEYVVFETKTGIKVANGLLTEAGFSENSGDFVYRINLSEVPEGGPYKIEVKGFGSSHPFGVGGAFSQKLSYISFRGLLHQRCGLEQKTPYFDHDIRERCHPTVYLTNSQSREAKIQILPGDSIVNTHGGYHDAGDADRRDHHMMAPMVLLTYFDMFPHYFTDLQFNIPDKFDEDFNPIGQGNGIPDIIDEAEWGTSIFEILQEQNGGVRSGTERSGYPTDDVGLDKDTDQYGAFRINKNSTALAAGLFAHLSRILKPYKPERAAELQKRAEMAWAFAGDSAIIGHQFYYLVQYYLLTGNQEIHNQLIQLAPKISIYETNHQGNPRQVHNTDVLFGAHFFSYLVQTEQPKNPGVVKIFEDVIDKVADRRLAELNANLWPNGTSEPNRWWGSQTAQGQYADPLLLKWRLTNDQKYIDAVSQLMDYNQGLNPIGKCFLTGTGFDRTSDPLHHDSYPMKEKGWGPAPGIQVFGPGNLGQLKELCPPMIPDIKSLPQQRQWMDSRRNVSGCEFTVPESIAYPSVIYTILSGGGIWDRKMDPYEINNNSN
jgi:endoglucanase